jgi:radical SAM superfamily enzyme YgiQ (UPF0313 family)
LLGVLSLKRVLLVGPMSTESAGERNWAAPPLGVHRIAAYLGEHGHFAEVYDCNLRNDFEKILKEDWDVIGFSPLQATLHNDIKAMWTAQRLCPQARLVVGGIEATLNYQDIFDNSPVKIVVLGEGEDQMLHLVNGIPPGDINGVIVKYDALPLSDDQYWEYWNNVNFAKLGYQQYWAEMRAKHPEDYDKEGGDTVRLVTSSHCNRGCTFCSVTQWHKFACGEITKPTMLNALRIVALLRKIKMQLPTTKSIYFVEDDFLQDRQRAMDFFNTIRGGYPGFRLQIQTHTSHLLAFPTDIPDIDLFRAMWRAGVKHITMGVENACPHCLKSFNKPQKLEVVPEIIKTCKQFEIRPYILIILFPAVATMDCLRKNVETLSEWINMGATISIEPNLMAYRGAPLYNSPHEMKYKVFDIDGKHRLRQPVAILPDNPDVRRVQATFNSLWPDFLELHSVRHGFKGATGKLMLELLKQIIERPPGERAGNSWIWNGEGMDEG